MDMTWVGSDKGEHGWWHHFTIIALVRNDASIRVVEGVYDYGNVCVVDFDPPNPGGLNVDMDEVFVTVLSRMAEQKLRDLFPMELLKETVR